MNQITEHRKMESLQAVIDWAILAARGSRARQMTLSPGKVTDGWQRCRLTLTDFAHKACGRVGTCWSQDSRIAYAAAAYR